MSVLVKGMEMPQSCMNCMFCGFAGANCELDTCLITGNAQRHIPHSKMSDCPLVPIPPHSDLIDRDKLREKEFIHDGDAYAVVMSRDIRNAATIIPADKDDET